MSLKSFFNFGRNKEPRIHNDFNNFLASHHEPYICDVEVERLDDRTLGIYGEGIELTHKVNFVTSNKNLNVLPINDVTKAIVLHSNIMFRKDGVKVYFKKKGNKHFYCGEESHHFALPVGSDYQVMIVPSACKWTPPTKLAPKSSNKNKKAPKYKK